MGSRNLPKSVTSPRLRAKSPSTLSVALKIRYRANAKNAQVAAAVEAEPVSYTHLQPAHALGVMEVHLTAEGADEIRLTGEDGEVSHEQTCLQSSEKSNASALEIEM